MNVGLLGCGNIGRYIAKAINKKMIDCRLVSVFDNNIWNSKFISSKFKQPVKIARNIDELVAGVDIVVEAASQDAVRKYAVGILKRGRNLMIMSVGVFYDDVLFYKMRDIAKRKGVKIYIPSGAIVGIDGVKSANMGKLRSVTLMTRKNPDALDIKTKGVRVVYNGSARVGVKKFPKNINVAATLSLAGVGFDKTKLKIIADPKIKRNRHEIDVVGDFGAFKTIANNIPSPDNPKTSYLAALSAIATLKKIVDPVQIGT